MKRNWTNILWMGAFLLVAACQSAPAATPEATEATLAVTVLPTATATPVTPTAAATATAALQPVVETEEQQPAPSPTATAIPATATPDPAAWQEWPVVPAISDRVVEIYRRGVEMGNNPYAFSKVGDCGSTPAWFMGDFDRGPKYYELGDYDELTEVIDVFQGSFDRTSLAAKAGYNASAVFTTLWSDRSQCEANENPLACEYRVHRPSIVFVMLGTNDVYHPDSFEPQMRRLIEFSIEQGIVPILTTKADNLEGDGSINMTIARLAAEYQVPLWNYWLAVQSLPNGGLQEDGAHLTWGPNRFNDPRAMRTAWTVRNLTALQALDAVWQKVK